MAISEIIILNKENLEEILPHRGEAMMIDKIIFENDDIKGTKFISTNDKYFEGHFPGNPVYPGHYLDEMQCLVAAILVKIKFPEVNGLPMVVAKNGVHYKKAVVPGDSLVISASLLESKFNRLFDFNTQIHNQNGKLVAEIESLRGIVAKP